MYGLWFHLMFLLMQSNKTNIQRGLLLGFLLLFFKKKKNKKERNEKIKEKKWHNSTALIARASITGSNCVGQAVNLAVSLVYRTSAQLNQTRAALLAVDLEHLGKCCRVVPASTP